MPTPTMADMFWWPGDAPAVRDLYLKYLGREPDPEGLAAHLQNPGGLSAVESLIRDSPEAKARPSGPGTTYTTPGWPVGTYAGPGAAETKTAWGFDTPTGGKRSFSYSPGSYTGEIANYSGFDAAKIADNDSIKYVFLRATQGLEPTVENLDEVVKRLNAQGIPAKKVGYDLIDFGLGEGPLDVVNQTRGGVWDWQGTGGTETGASPYMASMADWAQAPGVTPTPTVPVAPTPEAPAAPTPETPATDSGAGIAQQAAPLFESNGIQILEAKGNMIRVVTAEDRAAGNTYGTWISLQPSLGGLAG